MNQTPSLEVTRLDARRPPAHVVTNSLTLAIAQSAETTRESLGRLDLAAPALRGLEELGLGDRVALRPSGLSWRQGNWRGEIEVDVDIRVEPTSEDSSSLSITTRFSATDEDARVRLLDAWALVGPVASTLADRAARTVKEYAERDTFENAAVAVERRAA